MADSDVQISPTGAPSKAFNPASKDLGNGVRATIQLPAGPDGVPVPPATADGQASLLARIGEVQASPTANTLLDRLKAIATALAGTLTVTTDKLPTLGQKAKSGSVSVTHATDDPILTATLTTQGTADQDPIYDHTNGTKTSVTASATIITPPAGCKYLRISADADVVVNTAGIATVLDDGTAARIIANAPEIIPVTAGVAVKALSLSGTAVVRCTPLKSRS